MKVIVASTLIGAAAALLPQQQQVFKAPEQISNAIKQSAGTISKASWAKPLHQLEDSLKSLTGDAKKLFDEVAEMFPEAMEAASFLSMPKPHVRKAPGEWDHIVKGADIQDIWVSNENGEQERAIDGKLENYDMRIKKVDPSVLGIDKVKQYSGYLDDNENDKHLFYCKSRPSYYPASRSI